MNIKWIVIILMIILLIYIIIFNGNKTLHEHLIINPAPIPDIGIPLGNLNITSYNNQTRLTPIRLPMTDIVSFPYLDKKPYIDPNAIFNINDWKELVASIKMKIPHTYSDRYSTEEVKAMVTNSYRKILETDLKAQIDMTDYGFIENKGIEYNYFKDMRYSNIDYDWVNSIKGMVFSNLVDVFKDKSFKLGQCKSEYNPCELEEIDWRILKLGTNRRTGNKIIEGQILFAVKNRPLLLLLRYVASDENGYTLYTAYLDGIQDKSAREYEGQYKQYIPYKEYNPNPVIKDDVYDVSMGVPSFIPDKKVSDDVINKVIDRYYEMNEKRCFGKMAMTKNECEAVYDPAGNLFKVVGVWDKECRKDEDCPFYKANKNYPNNFGGCVRGQCQMPKGIMQISPTKYRNEKDALCFGCKDGGLKCCEEQKDINKYPNLKSPDYKFGGDELLRQQYYYQLSPI